ncbi:MerC domain-containing protein [Ferruginibacter sp.]
MKFKLNWDALGIITSVACAIHCALLPLIVTSLPVFGINIVDNKLFEWGMIALAFVVGSYALFHGYFVHHRSFTPIIVFSIGFVFLILKQLFHQLDYWFLVPAVILIVSAHYYNYRYCHRSKCSSPHHQH